MDERIKFIARILDDESMAAVCRDFNISRKTGYKSSNATMILVCRLDRPFAAALPACQSAAGPDRDTDRALQTGAPRRASTTTLFSTLSGRSAATQLFSATMACSNTSNSARPDFCKS